MQQDKLPVMPASPVCAGLNPSVLRSFQLLARVLGKTAEDGLSVWAPVTLWET